jgi:hypothetical protein
MSRLVKYESKSKDDKLGLIVCDQLTYLLGV